MGSQVYREENHSGGENQKKSLYPFGKTERIGFSTGTKASLFHTGGRCGGGGMQGKGTKGNRGQTRVAPNEGGFPNKDYGQKETQFLSGGGGGEKECGI